MKVNANQTKIYDIYSDQIGAPRLIVDAQGNEVWRWESLPFGETPPNENPQGKGKFSFKLRFPGQYADGETGLSYNYFRDYDPSTGRYVQPAPIGLLARVNTFAYVSNDPVLYSDVFGLQKARGGNARDRRNDRRNQRKQIPRNPGVNNVSGSNLVF